MVVVEEEPPFKRAFPSPEADEPFPETREDRVTSSSPSAVTLSEGLKLKEAFPDFEKSPLAAASFNLLASCSAVKATAYSNYFCWVSSVYAQVQSNAIVRR